MVEFASDELLRRVDEVLFYAWDPIGVSDDPSARHEYRSYVPAVLALVQRDVAVEEISAHLKDIVSSKMGLIPDDSRCDQAATLLIRHKQAIEDGCA